MNVLEEGTKEALKKYLANCAKHAAIDQEVAYKTTLTCMKAHDGIDVDVQDMYEMKLLEDRWYESLTTNVPDYSVYSSPYYFCEVWMCWSKYSRRYLKDIQSTTSMSNKSIVQDMVDVNTVLDLGCGFGYTTAGLKDIFPNANVYGTNIKESALFDVGSFDDGSLTTGLLRGLISDRAEHVLSNDSNLRIFLDGSSLSYNNN